MDARVVRLKLPVIRDAPFMSHAQVAHVAHRSGDNISLKYQLFIALICIKFIHLAGRDRAISIPTAAKARRQHVKFGRVGAARRRFDMPHGGEIAFQPGQ